MDHHATRILVVDDNPEMARTLCDGLADDGYQAIAASSGQEAIALLSREPFDALVTDLRMPDVDGFEVIAFARARDATRPIIAMTGAMPAEGIATSLRCGAALCLAKPFRQSELQAALHALLPASSWEGPPAAPPA